MSALSDASTGSTSTRNKLKELFAQSEALNNTMVEGASAAARAKPLGMAPSIALTHDIPGADAFMEGLPRISRNVAELEAAAMQLGRMCVREAREKSLMHYAYVGKRLVDVLVGWQVQAVQQRTGNKCTGRILIPLSRADLFCLQSKVLMQKG